MNHWLIFNCSFFRCCSLVLWVTAIITYYYQFSWAQVNSAVSISNWHFVRKPHSALNFNWIVINVERQMKLKVLCFMFLYLTILIAWKLKKKNKQRSAIMLLTDADILLINSFTQIFFNWPEKMTNDFWAISVDLSRLVYEIRIRWTIEFVFRFLFHIFLIFQIFLF